ncbi:MAG: phosphotransferase family protein [Fimbriimonadaceae bacterium]
MHNIDDPLRDFPQESVRRILRQAWDVDISVENIEVLRDKKCFRAHLSPSAGVPALSVIVKRAREGAGPTIDPDSASPNPSHRLLDEWAALQFLQHLAAVKDLAPSFYGGDRDSCTIVYEDFGPGRNLADALMGGEPDKAARALREHSKAVALLHSRTIGKEGLYIQLRDSLGPRVGLREGLGWTSPDHERARVARGLSAIGLIPEVEFWDEYEAMRLAVSRDGPYRSFVHNDSCPDNTWMIGGALKLIDFERGGYHHRLIDAVYARMSMPHCYLANTVPMDVVRASEREYRSWYDSGPAQLDEPEFGRELVHACFYWVVSAGLFRIEESLERDAEWGISTRRQRVIHRLGALAGACEEFAYLPATERVTRHAKARLEAAWGIDAMSVFPAFR